MLDLLPPSSFAEGQRASLDLIHELNRKHRAARPGVTELDERIASCELAYRMQSAAVEVGDLEKESTAVRTCYGLKHADSQVGKFGRKCLLARQTVQPIAALQTDLKQRGLLDETLVICASEFGRQHNAAGFTVWMAGGGVQPGTRIGATDAIGLMAIGQPCGFKDLHATILVALGLRADDLSFEHHGRPERLTGIAGGAEIIPGVLG